MSDFKIGDYVVNARRDWVSGFQPSGYRTCREGSICGDRYTTYCCDYKSNYLQIGITGRIVDIIHKPGGDLILVEWDNGGLCGKPSSSLEIDIQKTRNYKLEELGV